MKNIAFSLLLALFFATPAYCQLGDGGYHYSSGGARVVTQCAKSYHMPGLTAISPGTISPSARGIDGVGEQINPGLPKVPWGSTVGTCGDQQYGRQFQPENYYQTPAAAPILRNAVGRAVVMQGRGGGRSVMVSSPQQQMIAAGQAPMRLMGPAIPNSPGQQVALHNLALPGVSYGSHFGTAGDMLRSDLHPEQYKGNDIFWHGDPNAPRPGPPQYYHRRNNGAEVYDDGQHSAGALSY